MKNIESLKKLSIKIMLGSLVSMAVIAVIAVLAGQMTQILWRALITLGLVTLHALASLAFIEKNSKSDNADRLAFFYNAFFAINVLSFFTSVLGTWGVLGGVVVVKLYLAYCVLLFASLHGDALSKTLRKDNIIDKLVFANFMFMGIVVCMIQPAIFVSEAEALGDVYYRILAAAGIIDATLTILVIILFKLYLQKHPEEKSQLFSLQKTQFDTEGKPISIKIEERRRRMNPLLILLAIYLFAQIFMSFFFELLRGIRR